MLLDLAKFLGAVEEMHKVSQTVTEKHPPETAQKLQYDGTKPKPK